jgi:hypothetical protein
LQVRHTILSALAATAILAGCGGHARKPDVALRFVVKTPQGRSEPRVSCHPDNAQDLPDAHRACAGLNRDDSVLSLGRQNCTEARRWFVSIRGTFHGRRVSSTSCRRKDVKRIIAALGWKPPAPS